MNSLSILLVDDDKIERIKFLKALKNLNFQCQIFEAENGIDAFLQLKKIENSVDLIISDIQMPKMNGIEFITKIRESADFKKTPIVVMSNANNKKYKEICQNYNVLGFFSKPNNFTDYSKKVQTVLEDLRKKQILNS